MTDRILIVTPPDDTLLDGIRILHANLNPDQSQIVSDALLQSDTDHTIINYVWKPGDSVAWLLDKHKKSNIILFNANIENNGATELINGYIAAQPNSYYFGTLRDLHLVNNRAIYNTNDILTLIGKLTEKHAK
jgi:hypothetical protein